MDEPIGVSALHDAFRTAMRRLASGVAVITMRGSEGPVGMAATSVTSLTFDPLAVLFCVNQVASFHAHIAAESPVCVNLLSRQQLAVSKVFGSSAARAERFKKGAWEYDAEGLPMLTEAQFNLSCTIDRLIAYGTHTIVIAKANAVRNHMAVDPLIFLNGCYL